MARIRSIKPEFPQSESMGNVSREARLCFIMLWTVADDDGRLRGNSRMLASLLFPYDDDAKDLISHWLDELTKQKCIIQYEVDGSHYIQITKWLEHQKIDKPSKSKIPQFDDNSRNLAKPREGSSADLRIKDQGRDQGSNSVKDASSDEPASTDDGDGPKLDPPKIIDPGKVLFDEGVKLFGLYGVNARNSRSIIAKWQKQHGTQPVLNAVLNAGKAERHDVIAFIEGSLRALAPPQSSQSGSRAQQAQRFLQEVLNDVEDDRKQAG